MTTTTTNAASKTSAPLEQIGTICLLLELNGPGGASEYRSVKCPVKLTRKDGLVGSPCPSRNTAPKGEDAVWESTAPQMAHTAGPDDFTLSAALQEDGALTVFGGLKPQQAQLQRLWADVLARKEAQRDAELSADEASFGPTEPPAESSTDSADQPF